MKIPSSSIPGNDARVRGTEPWLVIGLMLVFGAFWVGPHGYRDLHEYLDNAERLWLTGSMRLPAPLPNGSRYYRYPVGLAIVSGPFVWAGAVLQRISNGWITRRGVIALMIPLAGIAACVLLFRIALCLGLSPTAALWGSAVFGVGSPLLNYTRMFYAEVVVVMFLLLAAWACLRSIAASTQTRFWLLLTGAGLAGATACHYAIVFLAAGFYAGVAWSIVSNRSPCPGMRIRHVARLSAVPVLAGAALLAMNWSRYGHPLATGYEAYHKEYAFGLSFVPQNLRPLLYLFLLVPWIVPAVVAAIPVVRRVRPLALGLLPALVAQELFWLSYSRISDWLVRYHVANLAFLAIGLPCLAERVHGYWPKRGLIYTGIVILLVNTCIFLHGFDWCPPLVTDISDASGGTVVYFPTWYKVAPVHDGRFHQYPQTAGGTAQFAVLGLLLIAGAYCFSRAARHAAGKSDCADMA